MKKRILTLLLVVLMMVGYAVPFASAEGTGNNVMKTFYVSPNGNDNNDGTSAGEPFKTLGRAKAAVDAINDNMTGDIVVYLMDGTWELEDTLSFGENDSGTNGYYVRYEAAPGASPMLSGGTKIDNTWEQTTVNGITAYKTTLDRDTKLRALYVNGERRYMAHTENAISAQGSWGTYTVGVEEQDTEDYTWEIVYTEDFEGSEVSVGQEGDAIQKFDKGNILENCVINVAAAGENNAALQIAHTVNGDSGFEIPNVTYRNAMITYRVQFAADHKFTLAYEALHMHGANKLEDENGRTTWAGVKLVSDLNKHYFQSGISGGDGDDDVTGMINDTSMTFEKGTWYQVKMMVTDDGQYLTKIWVDGESEPENWTRSDTFTNLNDQDKFLRIYAYKGSDNSTMNILVDDIMIQSGTKNENAGESQLPDWAWTTGTKFDGIKYSKSALPEITSNITDVEIENQQTWNKNTVCVSEIIEDGGNWVLRLQQPYGAIAQTPGWGVGLQGTGNHMIYNAFELLDQPGEFYFDREAQTLYYMPYEGEDMTKAEVVVPQLETIVEFKGTPAVSGNPTTAGETTITGQTKNIIFDGISIAHSDWNLQKVGDSYGKSTVQAGTVYTAFASGNWHADMYRNLDTIPGAVEMEFAHNIKFLNGEIKLTGAEGVLLSNDVDGCEVTGNYIYQTGGGGVVVGNPQHIYENDSLEPDTYYYKYVPDDGKPEVSADGAAASHEKYQDGTERVPRNVTVSNNLLVENCRLFPSHCPITSFFTQNLVVSNNFIKDAAYSGMSIGWGWCNFDGETNGNQWGTENNQGYAIVPNIPTNTCFGNQIVNNRIDTVMTVLHDGGLIYTLGKQEDTQISDNFVVNSQNHGIYQDEGSAYFKPIENNVIADVPSSGWSQAIFAPAYGRKHDLHYKNNYSNVNTTNVTAPNSSCEDFHYISDSVWPKEASDIIQNSGLTAEYRVRFADQLEKIYGTVQDALLPESASLTADETLSLNAWLDADDEIWLAPVGTTEFAEGDTMTKAAGNAESIELPSDGGELYLYVKQGDSYTVASKAVVKVEESLESKVQAALATTDEYSQTSLSALQAAYDTYQASEKTETDIAALQEAYDALVSYYSYEEYYAANPNVVGVTSNGNWASAGFTLESIVDNVIADMNGFHSADNGIGAYITIDLQSSRIIKELMIAPRTGYADRLAKNCDIYVSDTAPSYENGTISGLSENDKVVSVTFTTGGYEDAQQLPADTKGRYVTIKVNSTVGGGQCINISEIAMKLLANTISVESISLDKTEETLIVGEVGTLTATVTPAIASNKNVTWISDNNEVATVEGGVVTAISEGTATITVTTEDGNKTASCVITVTEDANGDVDNNSEINALDAAMVYAIANGKTDATEAQLAAADVNGDGEVTPMDAAMIYAYANGKITQFSASVNN